MKIRQATPNDIKNLQLLNDQIHVNDPSYDPDIVPKWGQSSTGADYFTNIISDKKALSIVVEDSKHQLIGYLTARPMEVNYRQSRYIEVENISVLPEHQREGIGSQLMTACLKWAKDKGFQKAYLSSYYKNISAIIFYENLGFSPIDIGLEKKI